MPTNLRFPGDLDNIYHFVKFSSFKYSRANRSSQPQVNQINGSVFLPMPSNLVVSYSADWSTPEFGIAGSMISDFVENSKNAIVTKLKNSTEWSDLVPTQKDFSSITDMIKNNLPSIVKSAKGAGAAWGMDALAGVGGAVGAPPEAVGAGLGVAKNPHISVYYVAPSLRTHNFSYKLSARNDTESNDIKEIIKFFKKAQAPELLQSFGNHLMEYPDEFSITFNNEQNLFKVMTCVLRDFTVNYHSQGIPAYFRDTKAPVDVDISLTFQEVNIVSKKEIDEGY